MNNKYKIIKLKNFPKIINKKIIAVIKIMKIKNNSNNIISNLEKHFIHIKG